MFPFQFTDTLQRFNVECTVSGGGRSSQVGALRLAISRALLCFLSEKEGEAMRQGGWCCATHRTCVEHCPRDACLGLFSQPVC